MADQILSQEEIDALMSAMSDGEVDLDASATEEKAEVVTYDLTSQSRIVHDQYQALVEVHDKFMNLLQSSLSTMLQRSLEVEYVSTEMISFDEFISAFSAPTSFNVFTMKPLVGSCLLTLESGLVFSLIDCMFGGDGRPLAKVHDFTFIEQRMIQKVVTEVLGALQSAWKIVYPVTMAFKKAESKPEFVHAINPSELLIAVVFSVRGKGFEGIFHLCKTCLMLDSIKESLSTPYLRERDKDEAGSSILKELLLRHTGQSERGSGPCHLQCERAPQSEGG